MKIYEIDMLGGRPHPQQILVVCFPFQPPHHTSNFNTNKFI